MSSSNNKQSYTDPSTLNLTVSIPSYEIQSSWSGSVAFFRIVVTDAESGTTATVLKRFNTFYDLRNALEEKYEKSLNPIDLPSLPAKKWKLLQDHSDPEFLTERRYALQEFFRRLCDIPGIGHDELVRGYLSLK
jgi:hypothetical protein